MIFTRVTRGGQDAVGKSPPTEGKKGGFFGRLGVVSGNVSAGLKNGGFTGIFTAVG